MAKQAQARHVRKRPYPMGAQQGHGAARALQVWNGVLYVGDKAELVALHDLNGDEEIDFVERKNQAFKGFDKSVEKIMADWKVPGLAVSGAIKLYARSQESGSSPPSAPASMPPGTPMWKILLTRAA